MPSQADTHKPAMAAMIKLRIAAAGLVEG
jgi:hypothetical protein